MPIRKQSSTSRRDYMNDSTFSRPSQCSDEFIGQEVGTLEQWGSLPVSVLLSPNSAPIVFLLSPAAAVLNLSTLPRVCSLSPVPESVLCPLGHTFVLWSCVNRCAQCQTYREEVVNLQERLQPPFLWSSVSASHWA